MVPDSSQPTERSPLIFHMGRCHEMCPTAHSRCEAEPGLEHGFLAPGRSGDNEGKWTVSDAKALMVQRRAGHGDMLTAF